MVKTDGEMLHEHNIQSTTVDPLLVATLNRGHLSTRDYCITIEPVLKTPPHGPCICGLSRQVVFADRFNYIEMYNLLPQISGLCFIKHTFLWNSLIYETESWSFKTGGLSC